MGKTVRHEKSWEGSSNRQFRSRQNKKKNRSIQIRTTFSPQTHDKSACNCGVCDECCEFDES